MPTPRRYIHIGSTTFYQGAARSQPEWEIAASQLLDEGQVFLAYDLAKIALASFPESVGLKQIMALALIRTGALDEARKVLDLLCPDFSPDDTTLMRISAELRKALTLGASEREYGSPSPEMLATLEQLLGEMSRAFGTLRPGPALEAETLGLFARFYKDTWQRSGDPHDARRARDTYLRSFLATGDTWLGINAATMAWISRDTAQAQDIARQVLRRCELTQARSRNEDAYWLAATIGEAQLLLGQEQQAIAAYREAVKQAGHRYARIVSSLQQLRLLQNHDLHVPDRLFTILKPPTVVIFTGHMIDRPDRPTPRFPSYLEGAARRALDEKLDALDAQIGYCSPACGADILFVEAMQDRGAEVNIVLPFDMEDFIQTSVAHAGPRWVTRFHRAVQLANSISYITEERFLGDELLFGFAAQIVQGYADLRARTLDTLPHLLVVWDGQPSSLVGGTGDIIARWPDQKRQQIIRTDELLKQTQALAIAASRPPASAETACPAIPSPTTRRERVIKTILFADVVGYSKLEEDQVPFFMQVFLERITADLKKMPHQPAFVNTWGDAIFAVMDSAMPMVEYALTLQRTVAATKWAELEQPLPAELSVRIALHAGPVFAGADPFTGAPNIYGSHVNRAARIEPVTLPGHIYASEQFVALLRVEQIAAEHAARSRGAVFHPACTCEYLGMLPLAKDFGAQAAYQIRGCAVAEHSQQDN